MDNDIYDYLHRRKLYMYIDDGDLCNVKHLIYKEGYIIDQKMINYAKRVKKLFERPYQHCYNEIIEFLETNKPKKEPWWIKWICIDYNT